jgi:hypothetical protein
MKPCANVRAQPIEGAELTLWISQVGDRWRRLDSNQRPTDYETVALAT